jgi:hypothetical protein
MIPRYAAFVIIMLSSLLFPSANAQNSNLSPEMQFALESRNYVLNLLNTNLEDNGKPELQCASVEYHVDNLMGDALERFAVIQNQRNWNALDAAELENGVVFILDLDPENPRAIVLAGIQDLPDGRTIIWFSRCLQLKK